MLRRLKLLEGASFTLVRSSASSPASSSPLSALTTAWLSRPRSSAIFVKASTRLSALSAATNERLRCIRLATSGSGLAFVRVATAVPVGLAIARVPHETDDAKQQGRRRGGSADLISPLMGQHTQGRLRLAARQRPADEPAGGDTGGHGPRPRSRCFLGRVVRQNEIEQGGVAGCACWARAGEEH